VKRVRSPSSAQTAAEERLKKNLEEARPCLPLVACFALRRSHGACGGWQLKKLEETVSEVKEAKEGKAADKGAYNPSLLRWRPLGCYVVALPRDLTQLAGVCVCAAKERAAEIAEVGLLHSLSAALLLSCE
jgi:hypothetical protein